MLAERCKSFLFLARVKIFEFFENFLAEENTPAVRA
jgi:hypothetical protein